MEDSHVMRRTPRPNSPTQPRMIVAANRERIAVEMRLQGRTFSDIAGACGYGDKSAARKAVLRALEHHVHEPIRDTVALHLARLDDIIGELYPKRGEPAAARVLVQLLDQRAKITGLYSAQQLEHRIAPRDYVEEGRQTVERVEEFQRLLGEVADREVQRRMAAQRTLNAGDDPDIAS